MTTALPILYSFRRCPYAMRARLALCQAGVPVELRVWPGVIHDFINMGRFLPEAAQAHTALAEAPKKAFAA